MHTGHTPDSQAADALLDDAIPTDFSEEPASSINDEMRLARIVEFQSESLAKANALQASLGALTGGLLAVGWRLEQRINNALATSSAAVEDVSRIMPALVPSCASR